MNPRELEKLLEVVHPLAKVTEGPQEALEWLTEAYTDGYLAGLERWEAIVEGYPDIVIADLEALHGTA